MFTITQFIYLILFISSFLLVHTNLLQSIYIYIYIYIHTHKSESKVLQYFAYLRHNLASLGKFFLWINELHMLSSLDTACVPLAKFVSITWHMALESTVLGLLELVRLSRFLQPKQNFLENMEDIERNITVLQLHTISKEMFERCFNQQKTHWNKCVEY